MTSVELADLAASGRDFRQEVFTADFVEVAGDHLRDVPDVVVGQYALTRQYHMTNSTHTEAVQRDGLSPGIGLFDAEDEAFFREQYNLQQRRRHDYNDDRVVSKYILGQESDGRSRGVYTTADNSDFHARTFAIPERARFLLRNLNHLSQLPEATEAVRQEALALVQKYSGKWVVNGRVEVDAFSVSPRSPQLAAALLKPCDYEMFGKEFGVSIMRQDQGQTMLEIQDTVPPEFLQPKTRRSFDSEEYISEVLASSGQVVFKRP